MKSKTIIAAIKTVINKKFKAPILTCVNLSDDFLSVTDCETYLSIPFKSGLNTCIPAEKFMAALGIIKEPQFTATTSKNSKDETISSVVAFQGQTKIKLSGDDPINFPVFPLESKDAPDFMQVGEISCQELEYLKEAIEFISLDDLRPAMTGVYMAEDIVATDAHRLFWKKLQNFNEKFIVPKKTIKTLLAFGGSWQIFYGTTYFPKDQTQKIEELQIKDKWGAFRNEDGVLITFKPIDARYPDYKVVIPRSQHTVSLEINPVVLRKELSHAMRFSNQKTQMGVLSLNGCVKLYTSDIDLSREYTVEFDKDDVNYDGELKIAFNMEFLDKIIANVPEKENLKFKFWAANRSAIINDQYLIMPLMLND